MKTKVHADRDDARVDGRTELKIETPEDCQMVQDRHDTLRGSQRDDEGDEELKSLEIALGKWHAKRQG